jgi:Orn/Lys/Arg decarboxylase, major domain
MTLQGQSWCLQGNASACSELAHLLQTHGLSADLTELIGLDNLAEAGGVIAQAQRHASRVFGARKTFFLVNGTSGGIHAAVGATCPPGSVLLASRASHSSVFNAITLAGAAHHRQPCPLMATRASVRCQSLLLQPRCTWWEGRCMTYLHDVLVRHMQVRHTCKCTVATANFGAAKL